MYVAMAVKQAHERLGKDFDVFQPNLLYAGGMDRGMVTAKTVEGKAVG